MISIATLIAAGAAPTQARIFCDPIRVACERFQINTTPRLAAFISQALHESQRFTKLEEDLWYRDPARIRMLWPNRVPSLAEAARLCRNPKGLANVVYANRYGNGTAASGDGWRFRGRGLFQLTFHANYQAAMIALGRPYLAHPELVATVEDAALTAAWFFSSKGCLGPADNSDVRGVTARINPPMEGLDSRLGLFDRAIEAFA